MCEKTIESEQNQPATDEEKATWAEDQKNRGYYYDDAHGYEIYTEDDDKDSDQNQT